MKACDYEKVSSLMYRLRKIEDDIVSAAGKQLGVTIVGTYQDEAMISVVRQHVITELQRRGQALQDELKKLGVSFERTGWFA